MAMIADVSVFQCDNCKATFVCKDDQSWEEFENRWHNGLMTHFCVGCKGKPEIMVIIAEERACFSEAARMTPEAANV